MPDRKKVFILALIMLACLFAGCGRMFSKSAGNSGEAYIRQYVKAILDNSYKNDSRLFVEIGVGTEEEAAKLYKEGIDIEIESLVTVFDGSGNLVRLDEKEELEWREVMKEIFSRVRYSVGAATATEGGNYIVSVSYEQAEVFKHTLDDYYAVLEEKADELQKLSSDALAYNTEVMRIYRQCFTNALKKLTYKPTQNVMVTVTKGEDGLYRIDDDMLFSLESMFLDTDYASDYGMGEIEEPGVTLGKYKGIEVEKKEFPVTEEQILVAIYGGLADGAESTDRTTVRLYDFVTMDVEIRLAGQSELLAEEKDIVMMIGSEALGEESGKAFDEKITGSRVGDVLEFTLKYPEDGIVDAAAGKDADFKIRVKGIKVLPELTDEYISENTDFSGYEPLYEYIREQLLIMSSNKTEQQFQNDVIAAIIEDSVFDSSLEREIAAFETELRKNYEDSAKQHGLSLEEYVRQALGMSLEQFNRALPDSARFQVKGEKVLLAVALKEGFNASEEDVDAYIDDLMYDYGYESREDVMKDYDLKTIRQLLLQNKALELVLGTAVVK